MSTTLTPTERKLVANVLQFAIDEMKRTLAIAHSRNPEGALCDSLRTWLAESAALLKRLQVK